MPIPDTSTDTETPVTATGRRRRRPGWRDRVNAAVARAAQAGADALRGPRGRR
tara:strand:- start:480 stop:638 length:159 start_codon:yes stop_codon:yes gene_type:complete